MLRNISQEPVKSFFRSRKSSHTQGEGKRRNPEVQGKNPKRLKSTSKTEKENTQIQSSAPLDVSPNLQYDAKSPKAEWVSEVVRTVRSRVMDGQHDPEVQQALVLTPEQEQIRSQVEDVVRDTVVGAHCNSLLLLGPRGAGKTLVLDRALASARAALPSSSLVALRLSGLAHADDVAALRELAKQLCQQQSLPYSRTASLQENLSFVQAMLVELARSSRAVVFQLEEFDLFALQPKQTLLYAILNAAHSAQVQSLVIGVSCRLDAAELLEKRVLSRFSHRKLVFNPVPDQHQALRFVENLMRVEVKDEAGDLQKAAYFDKFNASVTEVYSSSKVSSALSLQADLLSCPRQIALFASHTLANMDREVGVLQVRDVDKACRENLRGALGMALASCSVLELWLLVAMHRLRSWRKRPNVSFTEVYGECLGSGALAAQAVESFGRTCAGRAWENLMQAELTAEAAGVGGCGRRRQGIRFQQARLLVPECLLQETLQTHRQVPLALQSWMRQEHISVAAAAQ